MIDQVFIEVYPQSRDESARFRTDFAHYGAASHYHQPIDPDRDNRVLLRLPLRFEQGGNTGDVNGYVTYRGRPVPDPERNLRIRAFSPGAGPDCGIEGFAASAEKLQQASAGTATYYRTPPLAAGRCGAASQRLLDPGPLLPATRTEPAGQARRRGQGAAASGSTSPSDRSHRQRS